MYHGSSMKVEHPLYHPHQHQILKNPNSAISRVKSVPLIQIDFYFSITTRSDLIVFPFFLCLQYSFICCCCFEKIRYLGYGWKFQKMTTFSHCYNTEIFYQCVDVNLLSFPFHLLSFERLRESSLLRCWTLCKAQYPWSGRDRISHFEKKNRKRFSQQ